MGSVWVPSYEEMLKRWVSMVQWGSGTRLRAAAAVWRAEMGMLEVDVYGGLVRVVVKKVALRWVNSAALVKDLASARRRGVMYSEMERD